MEVRLFPAVFLASVVWCGIANPPLLACEQCDSGHACNACCQSDDRGLLDRLDSALVRHQPHLPSVSLPQLPALRDTFRGGLLGNCTGHRASHHRAGQSCGCELSQASCGCELTPASCGVELSGVKQWSHPQRQQDASELLQPQAPPAAEPAHTFQPRQQRAQPAPATPQVMPLRQHTPVESIPVPDSEADPFRDDAARVLRRVPAQSVQLKPSGRAYRQSYDPQARHESVQMSLSDHTLPTQQRNPLSFSQLPSTSLDAHGSSRQGNFATPMQAKRQLPLPAVVTASALTTSGSKPQATSASSQQLKGSRTSADSGRDRGMSASTAESRAASRSPVAGFNPLRSSGGR